MPLLSEENAPELQVQHGIHDSPGVVAPIGNWYVDAFRTSITIWDGETGMALRNLSVGSDFVEALALSPSGRTLAAASRFELFLFDVDSGKQRARVSLGPLEPFSDPFLAFGSEERITVFTKWITAYDSTTGEVLSNRPLTEGFESSAVSSDGTMGVWTSQDASFIGPSSRCCVARPRRPLHPRIHHAAVSPDGSLAAVSFSFGTGKDEKLTNVEVWNLRTAQRLYVMPGTADANEDDTQRLSFSRDSRLLVVSLTHNGKTEKPGSVDLFDASSGNAVGHVKVSKDIEIRSLEVRGRDLWIWTDDSTVERFSVQDGSQVAVHNSIAVGGETVGFTPDRKNVYVSGHSFHSWNIQSGQLSLEIDPDVEADSLDSWDVNSKNEIIFRNRQFLKVFDQFGTELRKRDKFVLDYTEDWSVSVEAEGHSLTRTKADGTEEDAPIEIKAPEGTFPVPNEFCDALSGMKLSNHGKYLACAGAAGTHTIRVISTDTGEVVWRLPLSASATAITFSDDDSELYIGTEGGNEWVGHVYRLRLSDGHYVQSDPVDGNVAGLTISPDGKTLLGAEWDNSVHSWDATSLQELPTRMTHPDWVNEVVYSPDGKTLATLGWDRIVRFWNTSGELLGSLMFFGDHQWLFVTPNGYFDGTPDAWREVLWRFGQNTFCFAPIERFMRDYYTPGLLATVMKDRQGTLPPMPSIAEIKNRVQPEVAIKSVIASADDATRVDVTVHAASHLDVERKQQSGLQDLRLFRDGQMVGSGYVDVRAACSGPGTQTGRVHGGYIRGALKDCDYTFHDVEVKSGATKMTFTAYAFNEERIKSATASMDYEPKQTFNASANKPKAYLLLIGVNHFGARECDLKDAVNDAETMSAELKARLYAQGYEPEVVKLESREGDDVKIAGKEAIRAQLESIAKKATPDDLFFVSFSGHGYSEEGGEFYILPSDIKGSCHAVDKTLLNSAISADELADWLRPIDAGEMTLILDACFSAKSVQSGDFKPGPLGSRGLGQLAYDKRMRILAASQTDEVAHEYDTLHQGLLTYVLTQDGLKEGKADWKPKDHKITVGEWLAYAVNALPTFVPPNQRDDSNSKAAHRPNDEPANTVLQVPALFDFSKTDALQLDFPSK
jgi:WD40 repeat protein